MGSKGKILLVDDDESICNVLSIILKKDGYEIVTSTRANEALAYFKTASLENPFDIIIQDIRMPDISGLELIKHFQEIDPNVIILVVTAFSDDKTAAEAMRQGAYDYIKKPFDTEIDLKPAINRAIQSHRLRQNLNIPNMIENFKFISTTPQIKEIYNLIRRIAPTNSTVLIQGESGTGKELIARSIHYQSTRASEPFLTVNCGAFSDSLLESELFGHVKGAFTNAFSDKKGLLEVTDKGTFFLDEVSELSPALQVKLLRAIEAKEFIPVGSTEMKRVDIRFIGATNTDLEKQVKNGSFREDLFYRLNVIFIQLPPLRQRKDDIPLLAGHFLSKYSKIMGKEVKAFSDQAMNFLISYHWPGNIRELENVVQRSVALTEDEIIQISLLSNREKLLSDTSKFYNATISKEISDFDVDLLSAKEINGFNLEVKIEEIEKKYIKNTLEQTKWNQTDAAKLLGLDTRALRYKIKKYNIS
ncbi:MAG: sigma-54 dependent transcriptional regulator [Planctomycetota bacterium]